MKNSKKKMSKKHEVIRLGLGVRVKLGYAYAPNFTETEKIYGCHIVR